jgi:hypothetical protein
LNRFGAIIGRRPGVGLATILRVDVEELRHRRRGR